MDEQYQLNKGDGCKRWQFWEMLELLTQTLVNAQRGTGTFHIAITRTLTSHPAGGTLGKTVWGYNVSFPEPVTCPKCGKEIYILKEWSTQVQGLEMTLGEDDEPQWDNLTTVYEAEAHGLYNETMYDCPECGATLFTDMDEAVKFLRGGD